MHRSSDLTDEPSRFKQFAWEQWENQPFAVLFRYVQIEIEKKDINLIRQKAFSKFNIIRNGQDSFFPL